MSKKKIAFLTVSVALLLSLVGGVVFGQSTQKEKFRYLSIFSEVFELVRNNYVESVSSDQLMDGAFNGVTDAIDEFSYYVTPTQMNAYKSFVDVEDNGIGLVVTKRFGYAYVISAVPGSPAANAGIERGDFIEKVGGTPTQRMAVWQVRTALRAPKVDVQVLRGGQTKRDNFIIEQKAFHPIAITTQQFGNVAYIKVPYFEKGTAAQVKTALDNVRKNNVRKLIIDVRGNAAGDVGEAITAADSLLTNGLITSLQGRNIDRKSWQADRNTDYDGDLEVLTDNSTAAGAEIFAAAIHGNARGKVVGVTTYGKSVMQRFIPLATGGGVYMTVAHYTTPEAKPIKDGGIKPDVVVDMSAQSLRSQDATAKEQAQRPKEDLILNKALSLFAETQAGTAKKAA